MKQFLFLLFLIFPITIFSQNNISLKLILSIGDKYLIERELNSITTQDVMGEIQIIKKNDSSLYEFEIVDKPSDSSYYIKIAFKRFKTIIEAKGEKNSFDTDTVKEENPLEDLYLSLINNNLYFLISDKGRHIRSDSLEHFYASFDSVSDTDKETLSTFKNMFNENTLKNLIPGILFPDKKVNLNESWTFPDTSSSGILQIINKKYTLGKITNNSYIIINRSDLETDKNKTLALNNVFLIYDLKGTMKRTGSYNSETCMLIQSNISQDASGNVSLKYVENSGSAYTWPIRIQNTIKIKVTKTNSNED